MEIFDGGDARRNVAVMDDYATVIVRTRDGLEFRMIDEGHGLRLMLLDGSVLVDPLAGNDVTLTRRPQ